MVTNEGFLHIFSDWPVELKHDNRGGGCCGHLMTDASANNGLREPLPANNCYSALCITQLGTHLPLIHALAPGLHPCIDIHYEEGFSTWTRAFLSASNYSNYRRVVLLEMSHLCPVELLIYTRIAVYVFLGAVRCCCECFSSKTQQLDTFQLAVCLQVYVWL